MLPSRTTQAAVLVILAISGQTRAATWSAPVALGRTTEGRASLSMSPTGFATAAFAYVTAGQNGIGSVSATQITPGSTWQPATGGIPSSYDAWLPAVGQDNAGNALLMANAGQFDNYSSAIMLCGAASGIAGNGCGLAAANMLLRQRSVIRFYGSATATPNPALYLLATGSCNLAVIGTIAGEEILLNRPADCPGASDLAANAQGAAVAGFIGKTGDVAVATRSLVSGSASWVATATLFQAPAGAALGSLALSIDGQGEAVAAWTLQPKGAKSPQAWGASMTGAGVWSTPQLLSATLCGKAIAAASLPGGGSAAAFAQHVGSSCELGVALHPSGGGFAAPVAWTSGAHVSALSAAGTSGGSYAFAYDDTALSAVLAVTGRAGAVGMPVKLGSAGTPSIAAGGGALAAVWCKTTCYGATAQLP